MLFLLLITINLFGQQNENTVGVLAIEQGVFDGLTLFSPAANTSIYLINNCGEVVHTWESENKPGNAVYLMEDGSLYRAGQQTNQSIHAGGGGGIIEKFDWDGNVVWSYIYSNTTVRAHHDFQILPSGNVLILAWEFKDEATSLENGRNPEILIDKKLWPEHIVEIQPAGLDGGNIVWEWHAWDHLIQDFDDTKLNFGTVSDHPEKIDLNYIRPDKTNADWMHANAINYNAELDQILLSVLNFDEVWVVDHSTTSEEASSSKGDLLFRWGNPLAYKSGTSADKKLFGQHNAQWIPKGLPDEGKLLIFNNGKDRPEGVYTSIVKVDPALSNGIYAKSTTGSFLPETYDWEYTKSPPTDFYSRFISGAQQLSNGNLLIDDGAHGTFFEINSSGEEVWKYVNPVTILGIAEQGSSVTTPSGNNTNTVFRATKYAYDYPAFTDKELTIGIPIELNYNLNACQIILDMHDEFRISMVYPSPAINELTIENFSGNFEIINSNGLLMKSGSVMGLSIVDISNLQNGLYFVRLENHSVKKILISR